MKGGAREGQLRTYGTLGTLAQADAPGGRWLAVSWTDGSGALYLFGGYGYDGAGALGDLNDLWRGQIYTVQAAAKDWVLYE
jgi:hypothetical protein